jgi:23S rRNA (cytosine1962-C5)-methyltransferase
MNTISNRTVSLTISEKAAKAVRTGHPWLYDNAVLKKNKDAATGDIAVLYDEKRKFAGIGLYDAESPIAVRILHTRPASIDREFLKNRIIEAHSKRQELTEDHTTTGFRIINGENDRLGAIVADLYDKTLVIKIDSACWLPYVQLLVNIFIEVIRPEAIVLRHSRIVKSDIPDGTVIYGRLPKDGVHFIENGIKFIADPVHGQKTGFFLDQRENRAKVGRLAKGLSVLNVFSYTGGFSIYAAKGGAKSVASLDISKPALDESEGIFRLNGASTPHEIICGDAFEEMEKLSGRKFDMVIVDPPSFARKQADVTNALKAYRRLNSLAVKLIDKKGILVAASCSARVSADEFFETVIKAVKSSGRNYTEIERTSHASDHISTFPEGAYLKCIFIKLDPGRSAPTG